MMALENIINKIFRNNNLNNIVSKRHRWYKQDERTTQFNNEFYNLVLRFTNLKREFKELTSGVQGQEWNINEDTNINEETLEKYHNYLSF